MLPLREEWARKNVDALLPYARRGVPIVGTEPSCLLTFRDEYPDLLRDDDSRAVAAQAFLLDELIVKLAQEDAASVKAAFRDDLQQRDPAARPLPPEGDRRGRSRRCRR